MSLLHQNAPPGALLAARIWVFAIWIVKIATEPLERLAEFPPASLPPIGVLKLLPDAVWPWLLTAGVLLAFRVLTVSCLLGSCVGPLQTVAAVASCVLLTFHQGLVRSIGYVNHSELPLLYAVYILAASAVIDRPGDRRSDVPLMAIAMVLGLTYTATGISRLVVGAPAVFHPDTPTVWIAGYSHETTYHGWSIGRAVLDLPLASRALLSAGLIVVTATEILAPCCLVSRRFRRFFLAVMIPFHLVTYVTMNIFFWENLALYVFLFDSANFRTLTPAEARDAVTWRRRRQTR
jgi:hypothetical protein